MDIRTFGLQNGLFLGRVGQQKSGPLQPVGVGVGMRAYPSYRFAYEPEKGSAFRDVGQNNTIIP